MDSEKRKFSRIPDNVKVNYRIISLGEVPEGFIDLRGGGISENISEGGTLFEASELIPLGSFLEVELHIDRLDFPIVLRGRVVRVEEIAEGRRYELGFQFTQVFDRDRNLLKKHLDFLGDQLPA